MPCIFATNSFLDVRLGSKYASEVAGQKPVTSLNMESSMRCSSGAFLVDFEQVPSYFVHTEPVFAIEKGCLPSAGSNISVSSTIFRFLVGYTELTLTISPEGFCKEKER